VSSRFSSRAHISALRRFARRSRAAANRNATATANITAVAMTTASSAGLRRAISGSSSNCILPVKEAEARYSLASAGTMQGQRTYRTLFAC
jgi:hypothetical protein